MTDKKISDLTARTTLDGTELIPVAVGGLNYKILTSDIVSDLGAGIPYYVSSTGSDSADGRTLSTAWQTIAKVNSSVFLLGDSILFEGGQTFSGSIVSSGHITFGSYGSGRATISSGASSGLTSTNFSGVTVRDLIFTGTVSTNNGIYIVNTLAGDVHLQNIKIINCNVSGYGRNGIYVFGNNGYAGYDDVLIDGCVVSDCCHTPAAAGGGTAGIMVQGGYGLAFAGASASHRNVTISNCSSNDNPGCVDTNWTGSGIFIGETQTGLIFNCKADNNGSGGTGLVGIWTADSNDVTIDGCVSSNNKSLGADGGGFDLDGGSTDCTIRNCYSHGNVGSGYLLFNFQDGFVGPSDGCVVANCISENDGVANCTISGTDQTNFRIYGNTFYQGSSSADNIKLGTGNLTGVIEDNAFIVSGSQKFIESGINATSVLFNGNRYVSTGTCTILWNSVTYSAVSIWATATSQELSGVQSFTGVSAGSVNLKGATSGTVTLQGQAASGTWTAQLPTGVGTSGYGLSTNGAAPAVLSWSPASMFVGSSPIVAGTPTRVLYEAAGNLLGEATAFTISSGQPNVATGSSYLWNSLNALYSVANVSGDNWFFGGSGNLTVSGYANVGVGPDSLAMTTGFNNMAIGAAALNACQGGHDNMAIGAAALISLISGNYNVAIGSQAGHALTTQSHVIAIGNAALNLAAGVDDGSVAIGSGALAIQNGAGAQNVAIGQSAGGALTIGQANTLIGTQTGGNITSSGYNTLIGHTTGSTLTSAGQQNIVIGALCDVPTATGTGQLCIGNYIYGTGLTGLGATISTGKIGIGIKAPATSLDVLTAIGIDSKSQFQSGTDGTFTMLNAAGTAFSFLQFGGTSASFPSLKRSTTTLIHRLADDSNDANSQAQLNFSSQTINIATTIPALYSSNMPELLGVAAGIDFELGAGAILEIT